MGGFPAIFAVFQQSRRRLGAEERLPVADHRAIIRRIGLLAAGERDAPRAGVLPYAAADAPLDSHDGVAVQPLVRLPLVALAQAPGTVPQVANLFLGPPVHAFQASAGIPQCKTRFRFLTEP